MKRSGIRENNQPYKEVKAMVGYRRNRVPGGTYFFTVALRDRQSILLVENIDLLRLAFVKARCSQAFKTNAIVIMPDHLHAIWTLPDFDTDYPGRWRAIKSSFTRLLIKRDLPMTKNQKGEYDLWQRRYWEHTIRDENDLNNHIDYIHYNPIKHGITDKVIDWPYSSFHRYVNLEILDKNWGSNITITQDIEYGE